MLTTKVKNEDGQLIILNAMEAAVVNRNQKMVDEILNATGYQIDITTLTAISKRVVEQKFFEVAPAEYLPVRVGEGAFSDSIMTYRDFSTGGDFETGMLNTGADNSRLASVSAAVDSITVPVRNWAKEIGWSLFDLAMAQKSGNWDLVTSKERSRKRNWDLGIQKIAFIGAESDANVKGLLTQSGITANTALITEYISGMNETEFQALLAGIIEAYRSNCSRTAMPTHFIIPEADYNGLAVSTSEQFPIKSKLQRLQETFALITRNPNFKVLPLAYADKLTNAAVTGLNKNRYTLLNFDEDSIRMDIPVDYTNTLQNTVNGFNYQNVGYGQFTGAQAYRPKELLYFDWA